MLAGYKRKSRYVRWIRDSQYNGRSATDWRSRINSAYIENFYKKGVKPRDLRVGQIMKMKHLPDLKRWNEEGRNEIGSLTGLRSCLIRENMEE